MNNRKDAITDLFSNEEKKLERNKIREIEKYKKRELKKEAKRKRQLEKEEDRAFSRLINKTDLKIEKYISYTYKVIIVSSLALILIYFIISFFQKKITIFNNILFFILSISTLISATIQNKKARKITTIITCFILILWILLHI